MLPFLVFTVLGVFSKLEHFFHNVFFNFESFFVYQIENSSMISLTWMIEKPSAYHLICYAQVSGGHHKVVDKTHVYADCKLTLFAQKFQYLSPFNQVVYNCDVFS